MEKRYFIETLINFILGLLIWVGITMYFDPSQQFKVTDYLAMGEDRIINAGLAKNAKYNMVIFGTSTSQNILKKDVDRIFDKSSINLSLSGATNYEQRKILEIALKKEPEKIIYGLDCFSYNRGFKESRIPLEKFIYENNYFELYRYFFNFSTFKGVVKAAIIKGLGRNDKNWLNTYGYWGDDYKYSKENTLNVNKDNKYGARNIGAIKLFEDGYSFELMKKNFDIFYELLKTNEDIEFLIYYPPYASLWWDYARKYNCEETILEFKKYVNGKLAFLTNVKLYDFQNEESIVSNLDNYKDMVHFSPNISKRIVEDINFNKNRVH